MIFVIANEPGHLSGGFPLNRIPKDYIQANREINRRVLGTVKQKWGSGSKLYVRGWFYVLAVFVVLKYVVPSVWSQLSALFR